MSKFAVNDRVRWSSQAAGHAKTKEGVVVYVVPAGQLPEAGVLKARHSAIDRFGGGRSRDHESYVVLVNRDGLKPYLYWPLAGQLEAV